jgi:hypothetical protein
MPESHPKHCGELTSLQVNSSNNCTNEPSIKTPLVWLTTTFTSFGFGFTIAEPAGQEYGGNESCERMLLIKTETKMKFIIDLFALFKASEKSLA